MDLMAIFSNCIFKEAKMHYRSSLLLRMLLLVLGSATLAPFLHAQKGACTEGAIKQEKITIADDVFMYMTPYGKPVFGKGATKSTNREKFSGRTNVKRSWVGEHRIVSSPSADMAYE